MQCAVVTKQQRCPAPAEFHCKAVHRTTGAVGYGGLCSDGHGRSFGDGFIVAQHKVGPECTISGSQWHDDGCRMPLTDEMIEELFRVPALTG